MGVDAAQRGRHEKSKEAAAPFATFFGLMQIPGHFPLFAENKRSWGLPRPFAPVPHNQLSLSLSLPGSLSPSRSLQHMAEAAVQLLPSLFLSFARVPGSGVAPLAGALSAPPTVVAGRGKMQCTTEATTEDGKTACNIKGNVAGRKDGLRTLPLLFFFFPRA